MSVLAWLNRGQPISAPLIIGGAPPAAEPRELPLLPLGPMPLLPGEKRDVVLSDPASRELLDFAAAHHQSCCAQLLVRGGGELVGITGLLEFEQHGEQGGTGTGGVRVSLRCVGRVGMVDLSQPEGKQILVAKVEPVLDDPDSASDEDADMAAMFGMGRGPNGEVSDAAASAIAKSAESSGLAEEEVLAQVQALLRNLEGELRTTLATLAATRATLWQRGAGDGGAADEVMAELEALGDERSATLDELIASRINVLSEAATAEGGGASCAGLSELWGVNAEAAKQQVLSFAAAATLGGMVRSNALTASSTPERLYLALAAAREQQRRMGAMLALKGAAND
jgi:hypothetical protein